MKTIIEFRFWIAIRFILFVFCASVIYHAKAQVGIDRPALPAADSYIVKNWFDVKTIGSQIPFDEDNAVIFSSNITIENLNWARYGGTPKHLVIIADTVRIGANNNLNLLSGYGQGSPGLQGLGGPTNVNPCSFIILCRTLIVDNKSYFTFNGGTNFYQAYYNTDNNPAAKFLGGYGATFLIAAEHVKPEQKLLENLKEGFLSMAEDFDLSLIGIDKNAHGNPDLFTFNQRLFNLRYRYLNFFSNDDKEKINQNLKGLVIDTPTVKTELLFEKMQLEHLDDDQLMQLIFGYTQSRGQRWENSNAPLPFHTVYPLNVSFTQSFFQQKQGFYAYLPTPFYINSMFNDDLPNGNGTFKSLGLFFYPACLEVAGVLTGRDALKTLSTEQHKLFSKWLLEWIKYQRNIAVTAKSEGNLTKLYKYLQQFTNMPLYQLDDPYNDQYLNISGQLSPLLVEAKDLISTKQIVTDHIATGTTVDVLTQGIPPKYYLSPSKILLTGIRSNGIMKYGIAEDIESPQQITRLTIEGELKIDPRMADAVQEKLQDDYGTNLQNGFLLGIVYSIEGISIPGIKQFSTRVNGKFIDFTIDIEQSALKEVLFKFATTGLPCNLNWTINGNPVQKGTLGNFSFMLNSRTGGFLDINGLQVTNNESGSTAIIKYVQTSKNRIISVNDLRVPPGKTVALDNLNLQSGESIIGVPDLGVEYQDDEFEDVLKRFALMPPGNILDHISVVNNIPPDVIFPKTGLHYQVTNVEVIVAEQNGQTIEPIAKGSLSPAKSQGDSMNATNTRLTTFVKSYQITGLVHFNDGGSVKLKPITFTGTDGSIGLNDLDFQ